ncbi:MAG: DUF971 domain-containing protein [Nitrospirota bacterium]|nr:DUF971 domain-containing protein [Nitrospirota bacterium]
MSHPLPQNIDAPSPQTVRILWRDGHESIYENRDLRVSCPCAGCVNEWTGERTVVESSIPRDIRPTSWHLVGQYALSIGFSDGHSTGLYSFEILRKLCPCPACRS